MAEEHLSTTPEGQEAPKNGDKLKPQDFTCEIDSQLSQLISLAELVRLMEETSASAGERNGFFYGIADIIEGCADRINSMAQATYDHLYDLGEMRALEKAKKAREAGATVLRVTAREIEEVAAHLITLHQDPEFDRQAELFITGVRSFSIRLKDYLDRAFVPVDEEKPTVEGQPPAPEIPKLKKILSRAHYEHIASIRRNIEYRADQLIQNPGSPLVPEEVAKIAQQIKIFAAMINEDLAI